MLCDFGTAPEQVKLGYKSLGIMVHGTAESVSQTFKHSGNVRLVKGAQVPGSETFEWLVMHKQ